jgi:hypothetical protein
VITRSRSLKIGDVVERHSIKFRIVAFPTLHVARLEPVDEPGLAAAFVPVIQLEKDVEK